MNITIHNPTISIQGVPAFANALFASLLRGGDEPEPFASTAIARPPIGEYWEGQGGLFAGDFRGEGTTFGLIVAAEQDVGRARWAPDGERDLSEWDGLDNTKRIRKECPAAELAVTYERDGHSDFYLPARREMALASANLHSTFGKDSWYWTSTPYAEHYAWAFGFENGYCFSHVRLREFRVRPFRRFVY